MARTHKKMSHLFGWVDYIPKDRKAVIPNVGNIKFEPLNQKNISQYERDILQMNPGEYMGFATGWEGHG